MALSAPEILQIAQDRRPVDYFRTARSYVDHVNMVKHKARISDLDKIIAGEWPDVWPEFDDLKKLRLKNLVGNAIRTDLEDVAKLAGGPIPTVMCDPDGESDAKEREARTRTRILASYAVRSRLQMQRRFMTMDLSACGLACWVISTDDPSGYPTFIRKDPRYLYPDPSFRGTDDIDNLVIAYRVKARAVEKMWPGTLSSLFSQREIDRRAIPDEIEVVEFYDDTMSAKVAGVVGSEGGRKQYRASILQSEPNRLGRPLFVIGVRPTADGQFRGQFDDAIGPLGVANEMMALHLLGVANEVWPIKVVKGTFENAEDVGPGATLRTDDPQATVEVVTPGGANPQMYANLEWLMNQARLSSGVPEARQGDIRQSIASAAFVSAIQGKYVTQVKDYQDIMADMEERANAIAMAVDETYLNFEKAASGVSDGGSFSITYVPSKAIAGRYDNRVVYGEGAGLDRFNATQMVLMLRNADLISEETAMKRLTESDPQAEQRQKAKEALDRAFLAGLAAPETPLMERARARTMLERGKTVAEIAEATLSALEETQVPEAMPTAGAPQEITAEAASLQRGGQPGRARRSRAQTPLPPLGELVAGPRG